MAYKYWCAGKVCGGIQVEADSNTLPEGWSMVDFSYREHSRFAICPDCLPSTISPLSVGNMLIKEMEPRDES